MIAKTSMTIISSGQTVFVFSGQTETGDTMRPPHG
jgi:hypothetical protein